MKLAAIGKDNLRDWKMGKKYHFFKKRGSIHQMGMMDTFFPQEMGSADIAGKKRWMGEDTALRARTETKKM